MATKMTLKAHSSEIKVAVVEDDLDFNSLLSDRLAEEGYKTEQLFTGESALNQIMRINPHFVLLDWNLPGKSGDEICRELRLLGFKNSVIMITSKNRDESKIDAYEFGASAYLEKPFNISILLAMLKSKAQVLTKSEEQNEYHFHGMIHYPHINLVYKNGFRIELTVIENLILTLLYHTPNHILSRSQIESHIWNKVTSGRSRSLDMHIMRLRKKIENNPDWPKIIITVKGKGLIFKMND